MSMALSFLYILSPVVLAAACSVYHQRHKFQFNKVPTDPDSLFTKVVQSLPHFVEQEDIQNIHLIVLVHGFLGTPLEMDYLKQSLTRMSESSSPSRSRFVIHSAETNNGKTYDGVSEGGMRLATEVEWIIDHYSRQHPTANLTLSMVGNSLGGLYCRYALKHIQSIAPGSTKQVQSKLFVTTCTPHLGTTGRHLYLPLPNALEWVVSKFLGHTGQDLFRRTPLLQEMTLDDTFVDPLKNFDHRIAYANAHGTDFQVPTSTAAFWDSTDSPHFEVDTSDTATSDLTNGTSNIVLQVQTPMQSPNHVEKESSNDGVVVSSSDLSRELDNLGWTKVLVDARPWIWSPWNFQYRRHGKKPEKDSKAFPRKESSTLLSPTTTTTEAEESTQATTWTASQLLKQFESGGMFPRVPPLGHIVLVANSKDALTRSLTHGGKGTMDYLAKTIIGYLSADPS
eukprot:Nitzschia sp. Nitz4//scaffold215_size37433//21798//23153//NITZ4_007753-RA/size37433-processed-gene-0.42-mRNA-1//1//CDS//3329542157//8861//frame0